MIKFFRKVRQNLLNEGKTNRYFKYALGEIILVVIGILIALQINIWNESRKQYVADIEFLKYIESEISRDITELTSKKIAYSAMNTGLEKTLFLFKNNSAITIDERKHISKSINSLEILTPVNKNTQRNDIKIADGALSRINNALNQKYISYLETTNYNNNIIAKLGGTLQNLSIQYILPKFDIETDPTTATYHFDFIEVKDDRLIKNAIAKSLRYRYVAISFIDAQIKKAQDLIIDIDKILERINNKRS